MTRGKVAVIGLGASGSFAARAAYDLNFDVSIYVVGGGLTKMPPGSTWLHWLPEDMTHQFQPTPIYVMGKGDGDAYTKRQWGRVYPSSFPSKPVWEHGYNPELVMEHLVPDECEMMPLTYPLSDRDVADLAHAFDVVFQTFASADSKREQPPLLPYIAAARFGTEVPSKNWVIYNGTEEGIVVREASLWGHHFLEFPKNVSLKEVKEHKDLSGYHTVELKDIDPRTKPWQGSIDPKVHYVGRWATWDRKYLSHDAYAHVQKILGGLNG